jgi:hypothetical protein
MHHLTIGFTQMEGLLIKPEARAILRPLCRKADEPNRNTNEPNYSNVRGRNVGGRRWRSGHRANGFHTTTGTKANFALDQWSLGTLYDVVRGTMNPLASKLSASDVAQATKLSSLWRARVASQGRGRALP